jgi:hypothetical protein
MSPSARAAVTLPLYLGRQDGHVGAELSELTKSGALTAGRRVDETCPKDRMP